MTHGIPPAPEGVPERVPRTWGRPAAPIISIAEAIEAWDQLGARSPEERQRIAAVLGFTYAAPTPAPAAAAPFFSPIQQAAAAHHESRFRPDLPPDPPRRAVAPAAAANVVGLRSTLEAVGVSHGTGVPTWALVTAPVPDDEVRHVEYAPVPAPLFTEGWTRATLGALCAAQVPGGPLDVGRILDAVCRRRPLPALPRRSIWTLRRGIQLLVDENEAFAYHARDTRDLVSTLESLTGRDRTEVLRFEFAPTRGVRRRPYAPMRVWTPPAPGTPILVVSDFALVRGARRRGASPSEWEAVAARARAARCPLLGIVPFAPWRWPRRLRRAVRLLRWDRTATAALARRVAAGELW